VFPFDPTSLEQDFLATGRKRKKVSTDGKPKRARTPLPARELNARNASFDRTTNETGCYIICSTLPWR
jgi:hypothetical protein